MEFTFAVDRVTRNAVRFYEESNGETASIGTVYLSKEVIRTLGLQDPSKARRLVLEVKEVSV